MTASKCVLMFSKFTKTRMRYSLAYRQAYLLEHRVCICYSTRIEAQSGIKEVSCFERCKWRAW